MRTTKMNQLGRLALLLSLTLQAAQILEASGPGTTSGDLLRVPASARAIGMGEAYTAVADDSSALSWNPAGLSLMQRNEASFMHTSLFEGVHYERLALGMPGDTFSFGGSVSYLGYGSIDGYENITGAPTGSISAYSYVLTGGLSTLLLERLSLGVTGSYLRQKLADTSAGTMAANAGILYSFAAQPFGAAYRVGLSALNLGPGLKFIDEREPLPRQYKAGLSALHVKELPLNLAADVTLPNDNDTHVNLGAEYIFKDLISLRLGYAGSKEEGSGARAGFGLRLRDTHFDYAFTDQGDLGSAHRVEVRFQWGDKMHPLNREQRAILKEARKAGSNEEYVDEILALNDILDADPANDRVLEKMIVAHEKMLKNELQDALVQNEAAPETQLAQDEVPSPEEFALQDLVPGQQSLAQAHGDFDPRDPLGLEKLPDASTGGELVPEPEIAAGVVPAPSAPAAVEAAPLSAPAAAEPAAVPEPDGVLLNPSDIYDN